jgi:vacuolar-type H+-ATPase subunit D/Vma8
MVLPGIKHQIRTIGQYISEREREAFYQLKRVKSILEKKEYKKVGK